MSWISRRARKPAKWTDTERPLELTHDATPEFMSQHAEISVEMFQTAAGVALDYSRDSLTAVDEVLGSWASDGSDAMAESIFRAGAYVGEVIVRNNAGSHWTVHDFFGSIPVVELASGAVNNPIGKAFKRVENGAEDSVVFFYTALVASEARGD